MKGYYQPDTALNFKTVPDLVRAMDDMIRGSHEAFNLDLSKIEDCDSAGLAMLLAVRRSCEKYNKKYILTHIPEKIKSLAHFCGVEQLLMQGAECVE